MQSMKNVIRASITVPMGKNGPDSLKKSHMDVLTESGDYKTDPPQAVAPAQKGFYKMRARKVRPECSADVTPDSSKNFGNCHS